MISLSNLTPQLIISVRCHAFVSISSFMASLLCIDDFSQGGLVTASSSSSSSSSAALSNSDKNKQQAPLDEKKRKLEERRQRLIEKTRAEKLQKMEGGGAGAGAGDG